MKKRLLLLLSLLCVATTKSTQEDLTKQSILEALKQTRLKLESLHPANTEALSQISCELLQMLELVKTITIKTAQKTVKKTIDFSAWGQLVEENNKKQHEPEESTENDYEEEGEE